MGFNLPVLNRRRRYLTSAFSPASLFTAGEQGAWYDPSDLSTMFQDTAGTTPVTAAGQSVGLWLDKSQGLALGPELVTNGDFSNGSTGWTLGAGWSVSSGAAVSVGGGNASLSQSGGSYVSGRIYQVTFNISVTSGYVLVYVANGNNVQISASGQRTLLLVASSSGGLSFFGFSFVGSIDNISVRELPGNHLTQSSASLRGIYGVEPVGGRRNLLTYTEQFDNAAWMKTRSSVTANATTSPDGTVDADTFVEDTTASNSHLLYRILGNPLAAATYTYSIYAKPAGRRYFQIILIVDPAGINVRYSVMFDLQTGAVTTTSTANSPTATADAIQAVGNGWYRCVISIGNPSGLRVDVAHALSNTPTSPAGAVAPIYTGDGTSGIYLWGAQLEAGSTATAYQRVVTAFDVTEAGVPSLSYIQFDGSDDWYISPTITPGIDKAQVFAGVRKPVENNSGTIVELSVAADANPGAFFLRASGGGAANYQWSVRSATTTNTPTISVAAPDTSVLDLLTDLGAPNTTTRRNGAQVASPAAPAGGGNFNAYPMYVGRRAGTSLPFNGRIYSLIVRFGANLPLATIQQTETWVNSKTGAY